MHKFKDKSKSARALEIMLDVLVKYAGYIMSRQVGSAIRRRLARGFLGS